MSWLKTFAALCLATVVAGCGFTPIAAPSGSVSADEQFVVREIIIESQDERYSYELRRGLDGFISVDPAAPYALAIRTRIERTDLAITRDDEITRFNLEALTTYRLVAPGDETAAYQGDTRAVASVNATTEIFATQASERAAMRKLAEGTSQKLVTALRIIALRQAQAGIQ